MSLINYSTKEITLKIVYYGAALGGKTTNLQQLHALLDPKHTGKLISLSTEADRTLFFDFLPIELGKLRDFSVRFQLYTVPGQIKYNATRKMVLKGTDAIVFIADSQKELIDENIESMENMRENLSANNINPDNIPVVIQYNKRDLNNIMTVEELNSKVNKKGYDYFEAIAIDGTGVYETLQKISHLLLKDLSKKYKIDLTEKLKEDKYEERPVEAKKEVETISTPEEVAASEHIEKGTKAFQESYEEESKIEHTAYADRRFMDSSTTPEPAKAKFTEGQIDGIKNSINDINEKLSKLVGEIDDFKAKMRQLFS